MLVHLVSPWEPLWLSTSPTNLQQIETKLLQILKKKTNWASKSRAGRFGRSWLGELEAGRAGIVQRRARKIMPSVLRKTSLSWWKELYRDSQAFPAQPSKLDRLPGHCSSLGKAPGHRWKVLQQFRHWRHSMQRLEWKGLNLSSSSAPLLQN